MKKYIQEYIYQKATKGYILLLFMEYHQNLLSELNNVLVYSRDCNTHTRVLYTRVSEVHGHTGFV